jgi:hypothetical protein
VRLLGAHRHRRWLPFAIPLFFAAVALTVNIRLAARNTARAMESDIRELHRILEAEIAAGDREATSSDPHTPAPPFHDDRPGR